MDLNKEKEQKNSMPRIEYNILAIILSICFIILAILAIKKYLTSTPKKPGSQSPESMSVEEIEMDEMGRFKCLRTRNNSSDEREHYSIYNSYNSLDGSWRLDRANGENRSLNDTDIRRALIDSRFHNDEGSAKNCCYSSSNFTQEETSEMEVSRNSNQQCTNTSHNQPSNIKKKKKKQAPPRPNIKETTILEEEEQNSLDASWCLDRSDGTNRSLNETEIEEKRPSAPMYPQLSFNPYYGDGPPPFPTLSPSSSWADTPTMGELEERARMEELEATGYNHEI